MTELIKSETINESIFKDDESIDSIINTVESLCKNYKYDIDSKKGRKDIASFAMKIAKTKTAIDEVGKVMVAGAKQEIKKIDNKRKQARDSLDELKVTFRQPLTEYENQEKQRIKTIEDLLISVKTSKEDYERNWISHDVSDMQSYLKTLEGLHKFDWCEYGNDAIILLSNTYDQVEKSIERKFKYDKEQLELESLRKEKEFERIREEKAKIVRETEDKIKKQQEYQVRKAEEEKQKLLENKEYRQSCISNMSNDINDVLSEIEHLSIDTYSEIMECLVNAIINNKIKHVKFDI